jgi:hypothetical protein
MSLPLIYIFSALFASSDMVFNNILENILNLNFFNNIEWNMRFLNIIIVSCIFIGTFSFLNFKYHFLNKKEEEKEVIYDDKRHIEINILM